MSMPLKILMNVQIIGAIQKGKSWIYYIKNEVFRQLNFERGNIRVRYKRILNDYFL